MSVKIILEIEVKPEAAVEMEAGMKAALPDTRAYDGCISVDAMKRADDPNVFVLFEEWETQGHLERYTQWRTETGFFDEWAPLMASEPTMTFLETIDA